jgi:hypothetical protein
MRMNQKRIKDTKSRQVVIKDLAEKGRKEIPSQGNIHPPARVATQDSTQQASSTNLHLSRSLRIIFLTAMQVANANWLEEYGTSLSGMATELPLERRQYGPYRQMSPLAKWDPETETHHKYKEGLGEKNAQRNRGSEAHHLAKA